MEKELNALDINLITGDKVNIPASGGGPGDWDGSFGMQSSMKSVGLESGKKIEADFVFVSVGNSPNTSLVEKLDKGAISGGLIAVDEYLRVSRSCTLTRIGAEQCIRSLPPLRRLR